MGGVVKPVAQAVGLSSKPKPTPSPFINMGIESGIKDIESRKTAGAEDGSRIERRRARRGSRALLSESRLNPEQGVSTLGTTGL